MAASLHITRCDSDNPDFRQLVALLDATLAILDGEDHAFYAQFNKIDKIKNAVVAYLDGEAVACGAFRPYDEQSVEIKRMFVWPEHRGKGIARAVLQAVENWAAEEGYQRCILETGQKQPEAINLYHSSGYHDIPNFGQYAGVENSVCMEKILL